MRLAFLIASAVALVTAPVGVGENDGGDSAAAFAAVTAVLDSLCGPPEAECRAIAIHRFVRRVKQFLPEKADSLGGSFELSLAVPESLTKRWPTRVADLGNNYTWGENELHVWLLLVQRPEKAVAARRFAVAVYSPVWEVRIGLVRVIRLHGRWIVDSVRWVAT